MSNPAFSMFMGNQQGANGFMQAVQQFKANPIQYLMANKLNLSIPQEIANDPNAILQHLVSTGQVSQNQVNAGYQRASNLGFRR